jgi:hypothetical protein
MASTPSSYAASSTVSSSFNVSSTVIYSMYIINKAGGLIYQKDFSAVPKLQGNDYLRLAGTFHALHAITSKGINIQPIDNNPTKSSSNSLPVNSGITSMVTSDFRLQCFQSLTGIKFLLIASPSYSFNALQSILQSIYSFYCDYVLKNPFYELEMPIRVEQFDQKLAAFINK